MSKREFVTLGEKLNFINGRAFKPTEWQKSGLPIIRIQNLNDHTATFNYFSGEYDERHLVRNNDLLFSWSGSRGTSFGPFMWRRGDGVLNQHIFKVVIKEPTTSKDFTFQYLRFITSQIEAVAHGSAGLVHITKEELEKFEFSAPPLPEQAKIAEILSTVDQVIELTEKEISRLEDLKKGMMNDFFTKGIGHTKFKDSPIGKIPESWEAKELCEIATIKGGFAFPSSALSFEQNDYQVLRMGNLYGGTLELKRNPVFISASVLTKRHLEFLLSKDDLLISLTGTMGKRDFGFVVQVGGQKNLLLNQRVCKIVAKQNGCNQSFLRYLLQSSYFYNPFFEAAEGGTGNQANVGTTQLQIIKFPIPSPKEQDCIAAALMSVDDCRIGLIVKINGLSQFKKALMNDLLTGKVRVKV